MKKTYVIDTNVLMSYPDAMFSFEDNDVVISSVTIEELDAHKNDPGDRGYNVRAAVRNLEKIKKKGNYQSGIKLDSGGVLKIVTPKQSTENFSNKTNDDLILGTAIDVARFTKNKSTVVLVSNDTLMRIKADIENINAEIYKHETVEDDFLTYTGRIEVHNLPKYSKNFEEIEDDVRNALKMDPLYDNGIKDNAYIEAGFIDGKRMIVHHKDGILTPVTVKKPFAVNPRNAGQICAIDALLSSACDTPLVIMKGPAGTAKTFLALACALEQIKNGDHYRRITLTRANVEFDRTIGALPGEESEKVGPLLRGATDNLEQILEKYYGNREEAESHLAEFIDSGIISIEALSYLRGRSLTNQILFVDEAQNTSVSQMKGILTRIGVGSKLVLSGDLDQIDDPKLDRHNNGLAYAMKVMSGDPMCAVIEFKDEEATRSPLARKVAEKIHTTESR